MTSFYPTGYTYDFWHQSNKLDYIAQAICASDKIRYYNDYSTDELIILTYYKKNVTTHRISSVELSTLESRFFNEQIKKSKPLS
jgi:hypothetical protein